MTFKENLCNTNIYKDLRITESSAMSMWTQWFDNLQCKQINNYFTQQDIAYIRQLAMSPSMQSHRKEMYALLEELMSARGFKLVGGGSNRRAYQHVVDNGVVAKIAIDSVGMENNMNDIYNQNILRPFCTKTFTVADNGTIALNEAVVPIKTIEEYRQYMDEIFDILYFKLRANDIAMDDIGVSRFKQWGLREGFGPVILDYPTMYVADPKKRFCRAIHNGVICNGTIDYDEGFDHIRCNECGATYKAHELKLPDGETYQRLAQKVGLINEGVKKMAIKIINNETGKVEKEFITSATSNHIDPKKNTSAKKKINIVEKTEEPTTTEEAVDRVIVPSSHKKPATRKMNIKIVDIMPEKTEDNNEKVIPSSVQQEQKFEEKPMVSEPSGDLTDKQTAFMKSFMDRNASVIAKVPYDKVVANSEVPIELAKMLNTMIVKENPYISREDAFELYTKVSIATMYPNAIKDCIIAKVGTLSNENICIADTMVNEMLESISGNKKMETNMFEIFYRVLLNVKNSKQFFDSVINFWNTMLEFEAFETDETPEGTIYCIYQDMMDIYHNGVLKAFNDFKFNITFSGGFVYTANNVLTYITTAISELKFYNEEDANMGYYDVNKYVMINLTKDFAEFSLVDSNVQNTLDNPPSVEEGIDTSAEEVNTEEGTLSPSELYDKYVGTTEEKGTEKQKRKYSRTDSKKTTTKRRTKKDSEEEEEVEEKPKRKRTTRKKTKDNE